MSNFVVPTVHPVSGETLNATWLDDHFGRHLYGVRFEGEEKIYRASELIKLDEPAATSATGSEEDVDD